MKKSAWFKLTLIIVSIAMVLSLAACGDPVEDDTQEDTTDKVEQTTDKETDPKETEPKETDPKETEPKETEPKETEPKETEPKETEPKETESETETETETETEPDPYEDFGYIALPEQLASAGTAGLGEKKVAEDGSYINLPGSGASDGWILAVANNTAPGQYVVMKYRLNNSTFTSRAGFCSNVNPAPADGSNQVKASMPLNPDGEWHIAVFNMSAFCKDDQLLPNDAGEVIMNYWRIDFADNMAADASMDVAYVGVIDNVADVVKFATAQGDKKVEVSETTDAVTTYYTSTGTTTPTAQDVYNFYFDATTISGMTMSQAANVEMTVAEDGSYVRYDRKAEFEDGNMMFLNGNTAVTGQYFVAKYRTNHPSDLDVWANTLANGHDGGTANVRVSFIADEAWHIAVVDLAALKSEKVVAAEDGTYTIQWGRFDFLNNRAAEGYIELAYVGYTDSIDVAMTIAKADKDVSIDIYSMADGAKTVTTIYTATGTTTPAPEILLTPEDIAGKEDNLASKNMTKEVSEDGTYIRFSRTETSTFDGYNMFLAGNTAVTGQYVAIKYRTNYVASAHFWANTTENGHAYQGAAGKTNHTMNFVTDEAWHWMIVDLSAKTPDYVVANENGEYIIQWSRLDVLDPQNGPANGYMDLAYVIYTDNLVEATTYMTAEEIAACDHAVLVDNVCPICGETVFTLNGDNLEGPFQFDGDLTLILANDTVSTITGTDLAVSCGGTLTIKGNGTLNIVVGQHTVEEAPEGTSVKGIKAGNVVIESGTLNITVGNEENTALIRNPAGISTGTLTVNGGNLNVTLGTSSTFGVKGSFKNAIYVTTAYIQNGGNVVVNSGKTVVGEGATSKWQENVALYSDDAIAINGGTLDLTAGERVDADSGVYAAYYGKAEHVTVAQGANVVANETNTVVKVTVPATLTIKAAAEMGAAMEHNTTTEEKYFITGVVEEVKHETYGNMNIVDAEGNMIYVYGLYSADGATRYDALEAKPVAGDTVTLLTVVGNYNGAQLKNAWLISLVPAAVEETPAE